MFEPECLSTGIGSLPHQDPVEAVSLILTYHPEIPFWPQLPHRGVQEEMTRQFAGDQPALRPERAAGFYEFIKRLTKKPLPSLIAVKGQIPGPLTCSGFLREEITEGTWEGLIETLMAKTLWQAEALRGHGVPVVVFLDEPALGNGRIRNREQIRGAWNRIIDAIHEKGGIAGIHCCQEADWTLPLSSRTDILSFDAWSHLKSLLAYRKEVRAFLAGGGSLGWGVIPTCEEIDIKGIGRAAAHLEAGVEELSSAGLPGERILRHSLITPSCGTGLLSRNHAERILYATRTLSLLMREKYCL